MEVGPVRWPREGFPLARGDRRPFDTLPSDFREALQERLGAPVVRAISQVEGFSPGVAARLRLADGRRVFLKAVSARVNSDARVIYRMEANVARRLPTGVPAPKLLWMVERGPWTALAFEEIPGRNPRLPWRHQDLARVLGALEILGKKLTPAPFRAPIFAVAHRDAFRNWRTLPPPGRASRKDLRGFGPWVRDHVGELTEAESRWERASRGRTLLHVDVRADNVLLTDREVYFVDWPWAAVGARWLDLLIFLPSVAMQGGPPPWKVFDSHPLSRRAHESDVDAVLAAVVGYFLFRGRLPQIVTLPGIRAFQWAQGLEALRWLHHRWEGRDPGRPTDRSRTI